MNTVAMNVSVEVTRCGGNGARVVMTAKKPALAKWQRGVQLQVKHHKVIREKWLDIIEKCRGIRVQVEAVSSTTSKSSASNQLNVTVFAATAHSVPTSNQSNREGQILSSEELSSSAIKPDSTSQYGRNESYQESKKLLTMQQPYNREEWIVKVLGVFQELTLDPAVLARLLLIFISMRIPFSIQNILKENPPEEAIQELVILIMVFVLVSILQGTNHLEDGMQITTKKQVLLLLIGLMSISGTHAGDPEGNIAQGCSAMDENAWGRGDYLKVSAFTWAALMGSTVVWWMWNRRAAPEFEVDRGLRRSPTPRRSNLTYEIHPKLGEELNS